MTEAAFVILDTNILLHYQRPDQIDWTGLCGAKQVVLVAGTQLLTELSDKKETHPNKQLRDRAREREKWCNDCIEQSDAPIRPGVFLREDGRETRHKVQELDLDPTVNDSAFIALLSIYLDEGKDACVATADGGMRSRLRTRKLRFLWLDETYKQETQPDPEKRRADQAERKLREIQDRLPVLQAETDGPWLVSRQSGYGSVAAYVAQQLGLTEKARVAADEARARQAVHLSVMIYDEQYNNDIRLLTSNFEQRHRWLSATQNAQRVRLTVRNTGNRSATGVRLRLRFPKHLLPYGLGNFGSPPPRLGPPFSAVTRHMPDLEHRPNFDDPNFPVPAIDGSPAVDRASRTATFSWSRIQNKEQADILSFWVVATIDAPVGSTYVQTEILCEEIGEDNFGKIAVDVLAPKPSG